METFLEQWRSDRGFLVLFAPHAGNDLILACAARLAQRATIQVLDGGNRFNAFRVARALRRLEPENWLQALERIRVARAFTCYQMVALLEQVSTGVQPTLVLDFLDTFYDESVPLVERRRLAEGGVACLQRISRQALVVAGVRPPRPPRTDPTGLVDLVRAAADEVWFPQEPSPPSQLSLF